MTRKSMLVLVLAVVVVAAALVVFANHRPDEGTANAGGDTTTTDIDVTSPYDMKEVTAGFDLDVVEGTSFVSVLMSGPDGTPVSYMADASGESAQALIAAVRDADEVDPAPVPTPSGGAIITFVLPTRETVTFAADLQAGLLFHEETAWRPAGDLQTLVGAVTTAPPT